MVWPHTLFGGYVRNIDKPMNGAYDEVTLVNRSGRVVRAKRWEVDNLKQFQGMRMIFNPKQEYYPEYDQSIIKQKDQVIVPEREENPDLLICDEV